MQEAGRPTEIVNARLCRPTETAMNDRLRGMEAHVSRPVSAADDAGGSQGLSGAMAEEPRGGKRGEGKDRRAKRVVTLTLPWPPQVNNLLTVARGRKILSKKARSFYDEAIVSVMQQGKAWRCLHGSLRLILVLYPPNRRRMDISNRVKAAEDALVKAGVIDDDSCVDSLVVERADPVAGGKVIVTVEER